MGIWDPVSLIFLLAVLSTTIAVSNTDGYTVEETYPEHEHVTDYEYVDSAKDDESPTSISESYRGKRGVKSGYKGHLGYYQCSGPEGLPGSCRPLATCAQYYATQDHYEYDKSTYYKSCVYGYGYKGVCCPDIYYTGRKRFIINYDPKKYGYDFKYNKLSPDAIEKAVAYALAYWEKNFEHDDHHGRGEDHDSYWGNGVVPTEYKRNLKNRGDLGYILALIAKYLKKEYNYKPESIYSGSGGLKMSDYIKYLPAKFHQYCTEEVKCYPSKYRTLDGTCNNVKHPTWGSLYSPLGRVIIPKYADGIYEPKRAQDGGYLPNTRKLRTHVLPDKSKEFKSVNVLYINHGQFVTHDVVATVFYQTHNGSFFDCCDGFRGHHKEVSEKCYTLDVKGDQFYGKHKQNCLNMARSMFGPSYGCSVGYASQINYQSHFHDCSLVYGKNKTDSDSLRTKHSGLLQLTKVDTEYYLKVDKDAECFKAAGNFCMSSGDLRTCIQPGVTVVQTIAARYHNFCAKKLAKLNPYWNDEKLFQEARRIVIAVYQHITYSEYLPISLGWKFMKDFGLLPVTKGYSYDYDPHANPWVYAEFSAAAFRDHTSVYGNMTLVDETYKIKRIVKLENLYNDPSIFKDHKNFNHLLRGMIYSDKRDNDNLYDSAISDYLLKDKRHFGLDLPSFNIKRGREYGLGSYNDYRYLCGLPIAKKWEDFHDTINVDIVTKMKEIYKYVYDVDAYTGMASERPVKDSLFGPTAWCIIGYQFQKLKFGDRFFYDRGGYQGAFTLAQLDQIRQMSMAALLCSVTGLEKVPVFAFRTISNGNPLVYCDDYEKIPRLHFGPWKAKY